MLEGLFASVYSTAVTLPAFLASAGLSLVLGCVIALIYRKTARGSATMAGALVLLPFLVQTVILLVNGNLGAGVAVAGAFSLIRFRSAPGSAQDIATIFLAMTAGLACGMGYLAVAVFATLAVCLVQMALAALAGGAAQDGSRDLRVTIPEELDYTGVFDDLFSRYTDRAELLRVKTANLGSLYSLRYQIHLKDAAQEKEFLDALRCRNGNLEIVCGRVPEHQETL